MEWQYIDKSGRLAFNEVFESASPFAEGVANVVKDGKSRFINTQGEYIFSRTFTESSSVSNSLIRMKWGSLFGFLNLSGEWAIEPEFASANHFREGVASVRKGSRAYLINKRGEVVLDPVSSRLGDLRCGLIVANLKGRQYYINLKGEEVAGPFDACEDFNDNVAKVFVDGKEYFIDNQGSTLFISNYPYISSFCEEGRIEFKDRCGKFGFLDRKGNVVIKPQYDHAGPFSEGVSSVSSGVEKGFIDTKGALLFIRKLMVLKDMKEGVASLSSDGRAYGYCDKNGGMLIEEKWKNTPFFSNGLASVRRY